MTSGQASNNIHIEIARSSNGRTAAFEAVYPGSNPGLAAIKNKTIAFCYGFIFIIAFSSSGPIMPFSSGQSVCRPKLEANFLVSDIRLFSRSANSW